MLKCSERVFFLTVFGELLCRLLTSGFFRQDAIWPLPEEKRPRILGLTASFLNGSISNLVQKRRKLESLMLSTIICPDVSAHAQQVSFHQVRWLPDRADFTVVQKHLDNALVKIGTVKEIKKVVSRCRHVADELGKNALFSYIDRVVVEQVLAKVQNLEEIGKKEERALVSAQKMRSSLPILQAELDKMKSGLKGEPTIQAMPSRSNKLEKLIELLSKILAEEQYSGIVFVEQAALVSALAKELNEALNISCGAVAGTQYQSTADRDKQIQKFREAEILLLVSTQALQEGIDVSGCGFVVRYSKISTTKAHIQGSGAFSSFECLLLTVPFLGRARHKNAKVYYFENDPDQERSKEVSMQEAAKDQTLSLSTTELREASKVVFLAQKHPFPFSSQSEQGQVNVNNCKQIFCQYCAGILGASVVPTKHLYTFEKNAPGVEERKILSIRYPSPDGWIEVNRSEWLDFFEGDDINLLFPRDRSKNKSTADKLELCFVYVVVVRLRERGFLDANNNINGNVPLRARSLCRLNSVADNGITISNTIYQTE